MSRSITWIQLRAAHREQPLVDRSGSSTYVLLLKKALAEQFGRPDYRLLKPRDEFVLVFNSARLGGLPSPQKLRLKHHSGDLASVQT